MNPYRYLLTPLLLLTAVPHGTSGQSPPAETRPAVEDVLPSQVFLARGGGIYNNYALQDYEYSDAALVQPDLRRNRYGPLGNFLIDGYDIYEWRETRTTQSTGDLARSNILKDRRMIWFQNVVVGGETHKSWAAKVIIADDLRSGFTPLTLKLSRLNGIRLDAEVPRGQFSVLASRVGNPVYGSSTGYEQRPAERDSEVLLGAHGEAQLGALTLGATGANLHFYDSQQDDFSLRGGLQSGQTFPSFIIVRFADDSPDDQRGGPVVSAVRLVVNGQPRPDLEPVFVRINLREPTSVGVTSAITGRFQRSPYPDLGTKYAEYFYLQRHLAGDDVDKYVSVDDLVRYVHLAPPVGEQRADGDQVVMAFFDLSGESYVRQVRAEALVGNDYRMEMIGLYQDEKKRRSNTKEEGFYQPVSMSSRLRAPGNVQDLSNRRWISLDAGVLTGQIVMGVNGKWQAGAGRLRWEYARMLVYRQYPDGTPGYREPKEMSGRRQWIGARSSDGRDAGAYYLTGTWREGWLEGGGEVFSIGPRFVSASGTVEFVEDNDDNDRWPDTGQPGETTGNEIHLGEPDADPDGVFPGKDEDNDGIPDTNRNGNDIPDYDEPFLLFEVEPDDYVFGLDWNHNGVPDEREDDFLSDYPYELDQQGTHFYGRVHLSGGLTLTAGRLKARGVAGGGRNENDYAHLSFRRQALGRAALRVETRLERVRDSVANPWQIFEEFTRRGKQGAVWMPAGTRHYRRAQIRDPLEWRDSQDRQHYLEGKWTPVSGLRLEGNVRHQVNHQLGGLQEDGIAQKEDNIRLWSSVAKAEYLWDLGSKWQITFQGKGLYLRRTRDSVPVRLVDEWSLIPILKAEYRLTPRTELRMGSQGLPGLPWRKKDRVNERRSMEEEVRAVQLSSQSPYYGYEISVNLGMQVTKRNYDDPSRTLEEVDLTSVFFRVFLGEGF